MRNSELRLGNCHIVENKRNGNSLFPALRHDVLNPCIVAAEWLIFEAELGFALATLLYALFNRVGKYEFALEWAEQKYLILETPKSAPYIPQY